MNSAEISKIYKEMLYAEEEKNGHNKDHPTV